MNVYKSVYIYALYGLNTAFELTGCRHSFGLVYAIYICIYGLVFRHMTYMSLFLDCFKNISVFLD